VLQPLISKGRVDRGWLGLARQPVLVPEALQTEAGQSRALMILRVAKDGPEARANLLAGDILVTIAGESVTSPAMLAQHLKPDLVGKPLELRPIRADKLLSKRRGCLGFRLVPSNSTSNRCSESSVLCLGL
jgi:S1-C subfamily serine protease